MDRNDILKPISTTLDDTNYLAWAQAMKSFLKGRKLWRFITGDISIPIQETTENNSLFADRLEDWESKHHQIITCFRNTTLPSIHGEFGRFDTAKEVWEFLEARFTITDLANQY